MPRGGRRPGAGRPNVIPEACEVEVFCAVEQWRGARQSDYEVKWEGDSLDQWSRGRWRDLDGETRKSLSDALEAISATGKSVVSAAQNAMTLAVEKAKEKGEDEVGQRRAGLKAAEKILRVEWDSETDAELAHVIALGWEFLRFKPKGKKTPSRYVIEGPNGEPIESIPPGLLWDAIESVAQEWSVSETTVHKIWRKWYWRQRKEMGDF